MAFRWCADDGSILNAGLVAFWFFLGIRTSIAKKPYINVIFQGGPYPCVPTSGFAHAHTTPVGGTTNND